MKFKRNTITKIIIASMGGLLIGQGAFARTFSNIEDEAQGSIVHIYDGGQHDELHLALQLNDYDYDVELNETIAHPFHLYFAYTQDEDVSVSGNNLLWKSGNIGSSTSPTDVYIFAAYSQSGTVSDNTITIEDGSFYTVSKSNDYPYESDESYGKIAAGKSDNGNLTGNATIVKGGHFYGGVEITGAYSNDQSQNQQQSNDNHVIVEGKETGLTFNTINDIAPSLYGAKMHTADVSGNSITIRNLSNSTTKFNQIHGANAVNGQVSNNKVQILNSQNFVVNEINGGHHGYDPYGDNRYLTAENNSVYIENSAFEFNEIFGAKNESGGATGNYVKIVDSQLTAREYAVISGGGSDDPSSYSMSNNTVHLVDVSIDSSGADSVKVIGGGHFWEWGDVLDNKVIIESSTDSEHTKDLASVMFMGAETGGAYGGNNLIIRRWKGAIGSVENFDSISFENFLWENEATLLQVNNHASIASTQLDVNTQSIRFEGELEEHFGEKMVLIQGTNEKLDFNSDYDQGVTIAIPSTLTEDSKGIIVNNRDENSIEFKLEGTIPSRQLELVSNNRNMGLFFVNHGAELILDNLDATSRDYHWGLRTFASIDGVQSNYSTKGHIDVHGFTAAAGLANSVLVNGIPLLMNLFVETGEGDYKEEMSYLGLERRFSGDVSYYGIGLSARIKNQAGWYAEGSLRAGKTETEVSQGLVDGNGVAHGYDISGEYFGAHLGLGRIIELPANKKLDLFAKYFYTYLPDDTVDIAADGVQNQFDFDSVSSSRIRVGGRVYFPVYQNFWAYTGLAYQYDFTPDVHVEVNGETIANGASMRGSMGIGSLGMRYKSENSPWVVDLKVRGYVGQREGISGKAQVEYRF